MLHSWCFGTATAIACCYLVLCYVWTTSLPRAYAPSQAILCLQLEIMVKREHYMVWSANDRGRTSQALKIRLHTPGPWIHAIGVDKTSSVVMSSLWNQIMSTSDELKPRPLKSPTTWILPFCPIHLN